MAKVISAEQVMPVEVNSNTPQMSLTTYFHAFIAQFYLYILSLTLIAIAGALFEMSVDYKIKEIIDTIAADRTAGLATLLALFVCYKLLHHGIYFIDRLLDIRFKPMIIEKTVTDMYAKTVRHSLHWFDSHLSGEIASKISDFQNSIMALISHLFQLFNIIAVVVIATIFLVKVNVSAALVLLGFILIYTPVIYLLLQKQIKLQESATQARQHTIGIVNDSIANIYTVKVVGNVTNEFKLKLLPALQNWKLAEKITKKYDAYYVDNADTIMVVMMSAVQIYLLAHLYQIGDISAGGFAFVAMMTLKIHSYLHSFLENLLFNINPSIAQIRSSFNFVNVPVDVVDSAAAIRLRRVNGAIEFKNVSFAYDDAKPVLQQFNLRIKPGERIGLVGTSGAGKTTLTKCLLRYFDVSGGAVLIDGHDIRTLSQASLRQAISIIPQDITMFHRSINENLRLAKYDATDAEIIIACKRAKIHGDIAKMPSGYDTVVGERGVKLSGGQRQRLAIARAILKNSPILILDEATSSLDTPTEQLIQQSLDELLVDAKLTVIAIAHRLSTLKHMDRIVVIEQGQIIEMGSHDDLLSREHSYYKNLWQMQVL